MIKFRNVAKYRVHQLYVFLKEAMPIIIVGMVIFFGAAILGFQRDNKVLIQNGNNTAIQLKQVLCEGIPDKDCNLTRAVLDLKKDNENQTIILCSVILRQNNLTDTEVAKVREICQREIDNYELDSNGGITAKPISTEQSNASQDPGQDNQSNDNNTNTNTQQQQNQDQSSVPDHEPLRIGEVPVCLPDPLSLINHGLCVTN